MRFLKILSARGKGTCIISIVRYRQIAVELKLQVDVLFFFKKKCICYLCTKKDVFVLKKRSAKKRLCVETSIHVCQHQIELTS